MKLLQKKNKVEKIKINWFGSPKIKRMPKLAYLVSPSEIEKNKIHCVYPYDWEILGKDAFIPLINTSPLYLNEELEFNSWQKL